MELTSLLTEQFRIDEYQKKGLEKLKVKTVRDLLFYLPARYSDMSEIREIKDIVPGESATVFGTITDAKTKKAFRRKIPMGEATIEDLSGKLKIIWFNQAYMAKMIHVGETVKLTGKIVQQKSKASLPAGRQGLYMTNPEFESTPDLPIDKHDTLFKGDDIASNDIRFPIYPETRGITSKWIYHTVQKIFKSGLIDTIEEYLPEEILKKYNLPSLRTALIWVHAPKKEDDSKAARKRFAFEEVFFIQLRKQEDRHEFFKKKSYPINTDKKDIALFMDRFPFDPTKGQKDAISQILSDMKIDHPMSRLLEGDVGSGKTAVAATSCYGIIKNRPDGQSFGNLQVAYMAPTEILATQLFENFINYFDHTGISVGLITGSGCRKYPSKIISQGKTWTDISRTQLLKWTANGEIPILIGTHALIQKSVIFKHLALVIIDEQHRFGTLQRSKLARKEGFAPHLLSMTATPIPRTLALTIYGDLDLTILEEMPKGRKPVITEIVTPDKREETYEKVRKELKAGRQAYIICPRIHEPDPEKELAVLAKSVQAEAKRLKKEIFPEYEFGIMHSKMSKDKKDDVMQDFAEKKIDILVATSVVEVGVNVPNATVIIIEGAERFGLAQLHQLRGRVLRSSDQAYCYLFAEAKSQKTTDRLKALKTAKNGFELSELDLALRGAGELGGGKQWGLTDLGMEAIKNLKMVQAARTEAQTLIATDPNLTGYPKLKIMMLSKRLPEHFE